MLTEHADDLALVDDDVEWISHFVGNSRINETDKFLLTLNGVIGEDLETLVNEAQDKAWFNGVDGLTVYWNLLDLELLEGWEALFFDKVHVVKTFDHLLDEEIESLKVLVLIIEAEDQLLKLLRVHDHNLSQGVVLALILLAGAILLIGPI